MYGNTVQILLVMEFVKCLSVCFKLTGKLG
jgi:hypothetical protein